MHPGPKIGYIFKSFRAVSDDELDLALSHY